jgi:perosamine synthetase
MHDNHPVVLTNSGSTALFVALLSYGLRPGDKVIVPSFGFVAVAQAVVTGV